MSECFDPAGAVLGDEATRLEPEHGSLLHRDHPGREAARAGPDGQRVATPRVPG